ncbi:hypothetical protein [Vagococcus fluvialis]|uniref:hypothetical protein n=1 Tax=Vagococcus fluvialis TaxID=2738 RepID=UPI00288EF311|nr:hypothetical protein [Vagococcus fluvialis]MDT2747056.1 hypothetical protein [Vagococcus fluvialis]
MQREIDYLEFEIDDYESELKRWVSGDLYNVKIVKGSSGSKLEDIIKEKKEELLVLNERKQKLLDFIYKFDDLDSQILIKKYIEEKKLNMIAEEMNYSESYIYQKHSDLIKKIHLLEKLTLNL